MNQGVTIASLTNLQVGRHIVCLPSTCLELLSVQSSAARDDSKDACKECPLHRLVSWRASISFAEWWASTFSLLFLKQGQAATALGRGHLAVTDGMWDLVDIKNHINHQVLKGKAWQWHFHHFRPLSTLLTCADLLFNYVPQCQVDVDLTCLFSPTIIMIGTTHILNPEEEKSECKKVFKEYADLNFSTIFTTVSLGNITQTE